MTYPFTPHLCSLSLCLCHIGTEMLIQQYTCNISCLPHFFAEKSVNLWWPCSFFFKERDISYPATLKMADFNLTFLPLFYPFEAFDNLTGKHWHSCAFFPFLHFHVSLENVRFLQNTCLLFHCWSLPISLFILIYTLHLLKSVRLLQNVKFKTY